MPQNIDSLEILLAKAAVTTIGDKDPRVMDYYVGTDIIEKNDSDTKVFAVSIFKIGPYRLYVPVFFINSRIEPIELIFIENIKRFVPFSQDWISYILNGANRTSKVGNVVDESDVIDRYDTSSGSNFSRFEVLPFLSKNSVNIKKLPKNAIIDILKEASPEQLIVMLEMLKDEGFSKAAQLFWDIDSVKNTIEDGFKKASEEIDNRMSKKTKVDKPSKVLEDPFEVLPENEKTKNNFYSDGFAVVDTNKNPSLVLRQNEVVSNPNSCGCYSVIMADGDLVDCVIMESPGTNEENYDDSPTSVYEQKDELNNQYIVIDPKSKQWCVTPSSEIFVYGDSNDEKFVKHISKLSKAVKITNFQVNPNFYSNDRVQSRKAKRYAILNRGDGDNEGVNVGAIFFVENKKINKKKDTVIIGTERNDDNWWGNVGESSLKIYISSRANGFTVDKKGHDTNIILNEDMPCIELTIKKNELNKLNLGGIDAFFNKLYKEGGFEKIKVSGDGVSYRISERSKEVYLDKKAALQYLIDEKGMNSNDSYSTLVCADHEQEAEIIVKKSSSFPGTAPIPNRTITSANGYLGTNIPTVIQDPREVQLPQTYSDYGFMSDKNNMPANLNSYRMTPERKEELARITRTDIDDAIRASQFGDNTIFDYSVIGSLAKYTNINEKILQYIKTFEVALNDLGEILFMFQWKGGDLINNFGTFELKDMEDLLKTVFKNFGDLLLKLKSKQRILEKTQDLI